MVGNNFSFNGYSQTLLEVKAIVIVMTDLNENIDYIMETVSSLASSSLVLTVRASTVQFPSQWENQRYA